MSDITLANPALEPTTLTPTPAATTLRPLGGFARGGGTPFTERLRALAEQPAVARSLPLLGFLGVVGAAALAWAVLREPPQRDLFRGLPDGDKAAVAAALDASQIGYAIDDASGTLTVSEEDYHRAKMALAAEGLPKSAPTGDEMISSLPMGASRAVENEKLRSAREMDLARSIEAMDSVVSARVHLAVDPPSIFIRDRNEPAASVILQLAQQARLPESQVQAIVHLVASSVPGLSADNISVVDQNGRLLSNNSRTGPLDETERQLKVREQIEERYRRNLIALLTPVLGEGNFVAEVAAEVDFAQRQATSETYPADEARLRTEQRSWSSEPQQAEAGGIPGALANQPPANATVAATAGAELTDDAAAAAETAAAGVRNEQLSRSFELGRQVSVTRDAIGTVERVSVAVAVRNLAGGKERSKQEIAAIEALVKGAVGFDAQRGDQVAISSRNFETTAPIEPAFYEAEWFMPLVRNVSALLVALALIFGFGRPLLKRRAAAAQAAAEKREAEAPSPLLAQAMARDGTAPTTVPAIDDSRPVTLDMISAAQSYQERALLIQNFVRQNPEHATLVVRDLLRASEGDKKEAINA